MGRASLGLEIGTSYDFLYSVLLLNAILGLDFLGLALSGAQVVGTPHGRNTARSRVELPNLSLALGVGTAGARALR
jgi:hypothetical protein